MPAKLKPLRSDRVKLVKSTSHQPDFDFEKFKKDNRRNLIILEKVFKLMKPIFEVTDSVEISVSDGHPQMRFTHNVHPKTKNA